MAYCDTLNNAQVCNVFNDENDRVARYKQSGIKITDITPEGDTLRDSIELRQEAKEELIRRGLWPI